MFVNNDLYYFLSDMTENKKRKEGDDLMTCLVIHVSLLSLHILRLFRHRISRRRMFELTSFVLFCIVLFDLFDLFLHVPSTIFQLNRDGPSWVEPVLS